MTRDADLEALRRQLETEALLMTHRRAVAGMLTGTMAIGAPEDARPFGRSRSSGSNRTAIAERLARRDAEREGVVAVLRDPCVRCGVRADLHGAAGCRRWVGST